MQENTATVLHNSAPASTSGYCSRELRCNSKMVYSSLFSPSLVSSTAIVVAAVAIFVISVWSLSGKKESEPWREGPESSFAVKELTYFVGKIKFCREEIKFCRGENQLLP